MPRSGLYRTAARATLFAGLSFLAGACAVGHCTRNTDCAHGESCVDTLCVAPAIDAGLDGGLDAGPDEDFDPPILTGGSSGGAAPSTGGSTPVIADAATPADAAPRADSSVGRDAATALDAALPTEAAVPADGALPSDAGTVPDASIDASLVDAGAMTSP